MATEIRLVVTDASPLTTLAAAASLDYLPLPDAPLLIPDAVFHEATAAAGRPGAQETLDRCRAADGRVRVEPAEAFPSAVAAPRLPRDLGERAALEVVRESRALPAAPGSRAILLADDRDLERLVAPDPARVVLLRTWEFPRQLEAARRIQSADATIAAARCPGRNPSTRSLWDQRVPETREAARAVLDRARHP